MKKVKISYGKWEMKFCIMKSEADAESEIEPSFLRLSADALSGAVFNQVIQSNLIKTGPLLQLK